MSEGVIEALKIVEKSLAGMAPHVIQADVVKSGINLIESQQQEIERLKTHLSKIYNLRMNSDSSMDVLEAISEIRELLAQENKDG